MANSHGAGNAGFSGGRIQRKANAGALHRWPGSPDAQGLGWVPRQWPAPIALVDERLDTGRQPLVMADTQQSCGLRQGLRKEDQPTDPVPCSTVNPVGGHTIEAVGTRSGLRLRTFVTARQGPHDLPLPHNNPNACRIHPCGSDHPPWLHKRAGNNLVESSSSSRLSLETFAEETEQPLAFWAHTNKVGHLS